MQNQMGSARAKKIGKKERIGAYIYTASEGDDGDIQKATR